MADLKRRIEVTPDYISKLAVGSLIAWMGIKIENIENGRVVAKMTITSNHMAPNGFLHAASIVALADSTCGCATIAHLPAKAKTFATIELKCNYLGTAKEGGLVCVAQIQHWGNTTQVWDATIKRANDDQTIALFRCTQMILWSD